MNLDKYIKMLIIQTGAKLDSSMWHDAEKGIRNAFTIRMPNRKPIKCYSKTQVVKELANIAGESIGSD